MNQVLTLKTIRDRCVEEGAECWIWQQGTNSDGCPSARDGGSTIPVRRKVWQLKNGMEIGRGWFVISSCANRLCVSPACAIRMTGKQYVAWRNENGTLNDAAQKSRRTLAVRARASTKLNLSAAAELRTRIERGEDRGVVAADYGISRGHSNKVARGENWRDEAFSIFNMAA